MPELRKLRRLSPNSADSAITVESAEKKPRPKMNTTPVLEQLKSGPDRGEDVEMLIRFIEMSERGVIK